MKKLILFIVTSLVAGCASTSYQKQEAPEIPPANAEIRIDYVGLQHMLGMDRGNDELGFQEKAFDSCEAGNGYSHTDNCRRLVFVTINFQLECRPMEGTVTTELSDADITPISNRVVDWSLGGKRGRTSTDVQGYGQMRFVFDSSQEKQRLKLNIGLEFLYMEAGDITRVVAPPSFCNRL